MGFDTYDALGGVKLGLGAEGIKSRADPHTIREWVWWMMHMSACFDPRFKVTFEAEESVEIAKFSVNGRSTINSRDSHCCEFGNRPFE